MRFFKPLIFIFLLVLTHINAPAQPNNIRFDRITINDGLSLSSVYTIYQDSKGFMWFGTEDGLNKFDGRNFQIYRPESGNKQSLSYRWTELIFEDSNGKLWFGSKAGLTYFDPVIEEFIRYNSKVNSCLGDTITCIHEQQNKQLWIGTKAGISMIDLKTNEIAFNGLEDLEIRVLRNIGAQLWIGTSHGLYTKSTSGEMKKISGILPADKELNISSIEVVAKSEVWLSAGAYLLKAEILPDDSIRWMDMSENISGIGQVEQLIIENEQNLWIASDIGLYKLDLESMKVSSVIRSIDQSHSLAINPAKPVYLDRPGKIWYGTHGAGLYRVNSQTGQVSNYLHNPNDLSSISENSINCIYEDGDENIWIGTFGAGISIYRPDAHKFGFMSRQSAKPNSLSSNFIWSIMECSDGKIWIGTDDAGLNIYDPISRQFQYFTHDPSRPGSISSSSVRKVYQDSKSRIWIGTDGGGLNRFYPESQRFESYKLDPGNPSSISGNSVRVIYEDKDHRLWIGTRSGLNLFDPIISSFRRYLHDDRDDSSISNNFIYSSIYHDEDGFLWIGTYGGGLNRLDIQTGKFKHFVNDPNDNQSISDNIVFSIHPESEHIFWIGTNSGLNRFDLKTARFERFGVEEGLPNEVIYGILPDEQNKLWLSTNKGICRFSLDDFSTKNFNINDGLQSNEFNGGAFHKGASGRLFFGGVYGLNIIDPDFSYIDLNKSKVVITSFEILGSKVQSNTHLTTKNNGNKIQKIRDQFYFTKNISYADELSIDYHQRFFSIEYAALNCVGCDLEFQYMMEGLDDQWNNAGNRNFVSFANMKPGEYTFKVRTLNADGLEGLTDANLRIRIDPPFWMTWWFYLLEALIIAAILVFAYKYLLKIRTNKLLRVQNEKIYHANQKLTESESNLKRLNATKDKFFSIISHDLKNPFTSLLSISELMASDYKNLDEEEKEQGIMRVHDSGKRIYNLLENLLTWSRAQSGRTSFKPQQLELVEMVEENIDLLKEAAEAKDIIMVKSTPELALAFGDQDMFNTVLRNLLNNAIKFSPKGKLIEVKVKDIKSSYEISVTDQGVGIAEEHLEKLFRIDAKYKTEGTAGEKGTGLGLIICKEFVEKNGGHIKVTSVIKEGTSFVFTIPKTSGFVR